MVDEIKILLEDPSIGNFKVRNMAVNASTSAYDESAYLLQGFSVQM